MEKKEPQNIWSKLSEICYRSMTVSFFFVAFLAMIDFPCSYEFCYLVLLSLMILTVVLVILSGLKESAIIRQKIKQFEYLPEGLYTITDALTEQKIGQLSNIHVDFLRKKFLEQGMDDNYFYFLSEIVEMFIDTENPDEVLAKFLRQSIEGKDVIELFWERAQK